jgi:hypothetical protein
VCAQCLGVFTSCCRTICSARSMPWLVLAEELPSSSKPLAPRCVGKSSFNSLNLGNLRWGSGANAHAELAGGSAEWVRSLRRESNPTAEREHGCTLMTDNRKDFPMNEVELDPLPADAWRLPPVSRNPIPAASVVTPVSFHPTVPAQRSPFPMAGCPEISRAVP